MFTLNEPEPMKRSHIHPLPEYYDRYILLADDIEVADAFQESIHLIDTIDHDRLHQLSDKTYAAGKWTVKDILQHLSDIERIHCY